MAAQQTQRAKAFSEFWKDKGNEKQETSRFWIQLLGEVVGIQSPTNYIEFEKRVKLKNTSFIDAYIPSTKVLIEQKSADVDLHKSYQQSDGQMLTPFQQAKRYADEMPLSIKPRWIVVCNFQEFLVYDMEQPQADPQQIFLKDLEKETYRLQFLVDEHNERLSREEEISLKAGELVGKLYDALLKQYINPDAQSLAALNVLCVRLVFCLYAEDAGLFKSRTSFEDYIKSFSPEHLRNGMIALFKALNTKIEDRDKYDAKLLEPFPYVDGGLFMAEDIEIPNFTQEIVDVLINDCCTFDWSEISPTIFGALFESTLNPETRRKGGMHYTSIPNIHKVIAPLFMDSLTEEYNDIVNAKYSVTAKKQKLFAFKHRLSELRFLDPACGSGNFLTETYLSLRRLENKIIEFLNDGERTIGYNEFISVKISQFYGIEINDFAVTVAKTALWIAESQMTIETEKILGQDIDFLPLKSNSNIVEGNALRINWATLKPEDSSIYTMPDTLFFGAIADTSPVKHYDYIIGNPPFVGAMWSKGNPREDIGLVFPECEQPGQIDYVCGWFVKAARLIRGTQIRCAFVATNSICQGQQVGLFWKWMLKDFGVKIDFAYKPFRWESESTQMAKVHCVIVGISDKKISTEKFIIDNDNNKNIVEHINGYLTPYSNFFVTGRSEQISNMPSMHIGGMARDGGYLILSEEEYVDYIAKEPQGKQFIHPYMMGNELINNIPRYCFWLVDVTPKQIKKCPILQKRIENVAKMRLASSAVETQKLANTPHLFAQRTQHTTDFIAIPKVSSERRLYLPINFLDKNTIVGDNVFAVENVGLYHFGVLASSIHNVWLRAIGGRHEMRLRYSNTIVYNNLVWPSPSEKQKTKIEQTAKKILDTRKKYVDNSLSDLYDPLLMPIDLRKAHRENDLAVIAAYGWDKNISEDEIVEKLFELYQQKNTAK